jgi:ElaB/YqjD/DUF883 family membrane-anchored ribosome-binding protein
MQGTALASAHDASHPIPETSMEDFSKPTDNEPAKRAMRNLMADVKVLASDTRELLRQTTNQSGEQFARLRERTRDTLSAVEQRLGPLQQKLAEGGRYAAQVSAEHLRAHRWSTLATVAAVAFAIAAVLAWQSETAHDDQPEQ